MEVFHTFLALIYLNMVLDIQFIQNGFQKKKQCQIENMKVFQRCTLKVRNRILNIHKQKQKNKMDEKYFHTNHKKYNDREVLQYILFRR